MMTNEKSNGSRLNTCSRPAQKRRARSGRSLLLDDKAFTLLELLAVVAILACLTLLAIPSYSAIKERAREARCMEELRNLERRINAYAISNKDGALPNALSDLNDMPQQVPIDPWGNPYVYVNLTNGGAPRKDIDTTPLNNDFDLYSKGSDGLTNLSLSDSTSADDMVRANNGSYVGTVRNY